MKKSAYLSAGIALMFAAFSPMVSAQTQSSTDLWDISQGNVITYDTTMDANSDIRDMFGGNFSASEPGDSRFQNGQPTNFVHAVEWQTPYYAQITNFNLFLSSDGSSSTNPPGMRCIGSLKLYAYNGASLQLLYSTNNIPVYVGPALISSILPVVSANHWRAEFTPVNIGPYNGPRIIELDGFGTINPPLNVPSDGSDGALIIGTNTVIDLSQAVTGTWSDNNTNNAGKGVYDPAKWAVVFKYSSVIISNGATVSFLNHPTHAPVVWLVQSNVVINGAIHLEGNNFTASYPDYLTPPEPGPGGFRGGAYGPTGYGAGYGPGGTGSGQTPEYASGYGGSYGNPTVLPLMGGSGAGAANPQVVGANGAGPAGAGAILLAAAGTVTIGGQITANATGISSHVFGGDQSAFSGGGAVRLVANSLQGNGTVSASVVRTEANSISSSLILTPNTVAVPPGTTPTIWPSTNAPVVTVLSVNGASAPADPLAGLSTSSDVNISTNNPVNIMLQAQNFPPSGSVVVRVTPKYANYFNVNASYVSGTFAQSIWQATTTLPNGFCVLQAHATSP